MKTIEEQIQNKCIHFNGIMNEACKCGINYKHAFGDRPVLKMPCIKDRMSHLKDEVLPCSQLQFPTQEDVSREIEEQNKHIKVVMLGLTAVQKHIRKTGERVGNIKCPNGDHKLIYSQAESNGHIWMSCKTCNISMMQ